MSFVVVLLLAGVVFGPILAALFAIALTLPRMFVGWYAFYAIAAILVFANLGDTHDEGLFAGLGTFLFKLLSVGAVIGGLLTRCVLEVVRRAE